MTRKSKPAASTANTLKVSGNDGIPRETLLAQIAVEPCMTAATVTTAFSRATFGDIDLTATHTALLDQTKRVHDGNMREVESTLIAQASALNAIFTELSRRAAMNAGEYLGAMETYLKLALRAQSQCRATLETLAAIKNPPVVFAKQANIAHGHQQVNNGESSAIARADEKTNSPNKLLEPPHGKPEWMDAGTAGTTAPSNSAMATVEARDRPAHG